MRHLHRRSPKFWICDTAVVVNKIVRILVEDDNELYPFIFGVNTNHFLSNLIKTDEVTS
jgi:hypothetical protein